jgi:hypothetical protein
MYYNPKIVVKKEKRIHRPKENFRTPEDKKNRKLFEN